MSRILYTTENLVAEVRSLLDEQNADSVDTTLDILPSLNRALDFAFDIYSRVYPEPILKPVDFQITGGVADYAIPEDVFEDRILKIEFALPSGNNVGRTFRECQRISYRDISNYESASVTNIPTYYCIFGRTIRFISTPSGAFNARIWQLRNPEQLVLPQGRVTKVNSTSNYAIVDQIGGDLTTESDQLESYVNWVDGQTGEIRATLQIASLNEEKVQFRSTPARSTVLNRTVSGSIPTDAGPDDYICSIAGICVPYYGRPTGNFLIGYSVAEISQLKLGGPEGAADKAVEKFEQQVSRSWVGRERQMRVQKRSQKWGVPARRLFFE